MSSSTSKQPTEKRRRTDNDSDERGICNFLKKVKNKIKYFNWFYFIIYKVNNDKYEKTFSKLLYQNSKILSKLDIVISAQKKLEKQVTKIETLLEKNENTDPDKTVLMVYYVNLQYVSSHNFVQMLTVNFYFN
jgi:hypothetical protein